MKLQPSQTAQGAANTMEISLNVLEKKLKKK
jgi:hypothetical protein